MSDPVTYPPVSDQTFADDQPPTQYENVPASAPASPSTPAEPRRVRLVLTKVSALSVMKISLLLSVAAGIMFVVAVSVVWFMLDALHVFSTIKDLVSTMLDSESNAFTALVEYMKFSSAFSISLLIAVSNIFLSTALSTVGALLYNLTSALVGGIHLTLADE